MDKRVLAAAAEVSAKKLAHITILGKPDQIATEARCLGLDLSSCTVVDHTVCSALAQAQHSTMNLLEVLSDY